MWDKLVQLERSAKITLDLCIQCDNQFFTPLFYKYFVSHLCIKNHGKREALSFRKNGNWVFGVDSGSYVLSFLGYTNPSSNGFLLEKQYWCTWPPETISQFKQLLA